MPGIMTILPDQATGIRKVFFHWVRRQYCARHAIVITRSTPS